MASALGRDAELATGIAEEVRDEAGAVVSDDTTNRDGEAFEVGHSLPQEVAGGDCFSSGYMAVNAMRE